MIYEDLKFPTAQEARERSGDEIGVREYLRLIKRLIERSIEAHQGGLTLLIKKSPLCQDNPSPDQLGFRIGKLRIFLMSLGYRWIKDHDDPFQVELEWK